MARSWPRHVGWPEVVLGLALLGILVARFGPELATGAGVPVRAPELTLPTLDGDTLRLRELRGSVVLVNFWATWCAPCQVEMPVLQRVWEAERDRGLLVVGLSTDTGPISDFTHGLRRAGITYPLALAPPEAARRLGHGGALPTSLLIDREGRIRKRVEGALNEAALRALLEPLLSE